jgi:benzoyl-CoA reductase subunit C
LSAISLNSMALPSITNPYRKWHSRYPGHRAFGYLCPYAPLELLHAAGLVPIRLMQLAGPVVQANAHLPAFACALVRTVTERMLSGELDFLEGALFVHTCDTMQCAADIWRMASPRFKVLNFSLPTVLSHASAHDYLLAELHELASALQSAFGIEVNQEALRASIALYNEQRRLLAALYDHRGALPVDQLWSLTLAAMLMPPVEYNVVLGKALRQAADQQGLVTHGPAIILVGSVLDDPTIPELIAELGGQVVGDDLCTGSRYFDTLVDEQREPYVALADRYLLRTPCPAKHDAARPHAGRLLDQVHRTRAQGVIFALPKFCDPHAFDYVPLAHALTEAGVPHLLIETDVTVSAGQLRTRVQAFLEMLSHASGDAGASGSLEC